MTELILLAFSKGSSGEEREMMGMQISDSNPSQTAAM